KFKWMGNLDASDDVSEFLIYQDVCASFELEHAQRAYVARASKRIKNSDDDEVEAAHALGRRLFFDRAGGAGTYGNVPEIQHKHELKLKTSTSGNADDPDHPAKLVSELEKTGQGCLFMSEKWAALKAALERRGFWNGPNRLVATRLLGRQPTEGTIDRNVALIFVANDCLKG